jgi:hypoxanthine phosphoribosyltransferase
MPLPDAPVPLITTTEIQSRVSGLAAAIRRDLPGDVHLVAVLKGAFVFLADLMRALGAPLTVDFLALSSYSGARTSSGEVRLLKDLDIPLEGRDVLLVEDIVDTGRTIAYLQEVLLARRPRSLRTACLLDKPSRRRVSVTVDYVGFAIEDRFVVGYGLDDRERFRHLPYIGVVDDHA